VDEGEPKKGTSRTANQDHQAHQDYQLGGRLRSARGRLGNGLGRKQLGHTLSGPTSTILGHSQRAQNTF
jgi:hypothetical protein